MIKIGKFAAAVMLATLAACDRPAAAPAQPSPARPSEQWQSVRLPTSEHCNEVACLFGLSGVNRPTIVSIRLVPFAAIRNDQRCRPKFTTPFLEGQTLELSSWQFFAEEAGVPSACPVFLPNTGLANWQRSDHRNSFERQNQLAYGFVPAGFSDGTDARRIRCAIVVGPSAARWDHGMPTLRQAAEICVVLFFFRRDGE